MMITMTMTMMKMIMMIMIMIKMMSMMKIMMMMTITMVVKGEYITLDGKSRRTSGHVFLDYKPSSMVYHFTNLIVGMNIHLQTMSNNKSTKVCYFFPHQEHDILMEAISNRKDPDGYIE